MKKAQLIEWGIITIGIIFGYKFFEATFFFIVQYTFGRGMGYMKNDILLSSSMVVALYFVLFIFLLRRSGQIANWLADNTAGANVPIRIGKRSLLQVILIGICIVSILASLTNIITYLVETFTDQAGNKRMDGDFGKFSPRLDFKAGLVELIISSVVLYFSKDISHWFVQKDEVDELVFDSNPQKD